MSQDEIEIKPKPVIENRSVKITSIPVRVFLNLSEWKFVRYDENRRYIYGYPVNQFDLSLPGEQKEYYSVQVRQDSFATVIEQVKRGGILMCDVSMNIQENKPKKVRFILYPMSNTPSTTSYVLAHVKTIETLPEKAIILVRTSNAVIGGYRIDVNTQNTRRVIHSFIVARKPTIIQKLVHDNRARYVVTEFKESVPLTTIGMTKIVDNEDENEVVIYDGRNT